MAKCWCYDYCPETDNVRKYCEGEARCKVDDTGKCNAIQEKNWCFDGDSCPHRKGGEDENSC